jgi:hypothetical protein
MAKSKAQILLDIHAEALVEFDNIQSSVRDERQQCLDDRRFYSIAGAQWEGELGAQFENKPKMEVNKIHLAVTRIINEYRNNRITVDFVSKEGLEYDKLAEACDGLYRADEQDSGAEEAYDNAFEEAVGGGFGAWRLRAEYEDEEDDENDHQRICIEPIYDADSCVFFDLNAKKQDKSDARRCFVLNSMSRAEYEEEWGDDPDSWNHDITSSEFDWAPDDTVYVAEYYRVEMRRETVHIYETLDGEEERYTDSDFENDPELETMLLSIGTTKTGEKRVKRRRVHKYIMSGGRILEDAGLIAGRNIPIVPVYGKRWFVDNVERCMGHVRLAKDAQRLKNMQLSKLAEISAISSTEKPILAPEQVAGHETMWSEDNLKNYPYLLLNPLIDEAGNTVATGPTAYTKPPSIPPALAVLLQLTDADMKELLGNQEAGEQIIPNISGAAIEKIQTRLDMQAYIYMSNMAKAIKRSGEIWLGMAKDVLVESGRKLKTVGKQYEMGQVELNRPVMGESGETEYENDMSEAKFDIYVDVGPSSSSKRQSTVRTLIGLMQATTDPETLQVLSAMIMMNVEGEGVDEVRDYFRSRLVKMGVVKPTEEEAEQLAAAAQNAPADPNAEYLKSASENEQAKAAKARADTVLTLAKAEETQAKTVETLSGIDRVERQQYAETVKAVQAESAQPLNVGE